MSATPFAVDTGPAEVRAVPASLQAAREAFRALSRQVLRSPSQLIVHIERLETAEVLPDAEPLQGALADLFYGCAGQASPAQLTSAVQAARGRLNQQVALRFEQAALVGSLPRCTRLATRWSVLARTSLDIPRRERRCSVDLSRTLARRAIHAWQAQDAGALDTFLEHCRVCRDSLAFMQVRREILRRGETLPPRWRDIFVLLQAAAGSS